MCTGKNKQTNSAMITHVLYYLILKFINTIKHFMVMCLFVFFCFFLNVTVGAAADDDDPDGTVFWSSFSKVGLKISSCSFLESDSKHTGA